MSHIARGVSGEESYMEGLHNNIIETFCWGCRPNKKAKSGLAGWSCVRHYNPEPDNIRWRVRSWHIKRESGYKAHATLSHKIQTSQKVEHLNDECSQNELLRQMRYNPRQHKMNAFARWEKSHIQWFGCGLKRPTATSEM